MKYLNLGECIADLRRNNLLKVIDYEVDPNLELAAIQRRALRGGSPALLFPKVKNCAFPMLANLFGSRERVNFIFRDTLGKLKDLFDLAANLPDFIRHPLKYRKIPGTAWACLPRKVKSGPVLERSCAKGDLPQLISWPGDGGAFVTLPQVYTEHPSRAGWFNSNLGMYRVQISGNQYAPDEAGMHYQIHRGIGCHHAEALRLGKPLRVNIFVGGTPAMTLAAIMPAPEGIPELAMAGLLAGFRIPVLDRPGNLLMPAQADFCITGEIAPFTKPEGPFGDHLGYYSLMHDFPVLKIHGIHHRSDAIWPFTSVGRPPQEDTMFGEIIHEITDPLLSRVFPGIHELHAVDAAGVHPLLLGIGSERYVPWTPRADRLPQELLTAGFSLLGSTQTSLAKFVILAAREDGEQLSARNIPCFFKHVLERTHFERDLHFMTKTTVDTLDYSGISLNQGSKLLWTVVGQPVRELLTELDADLHLPDCFSRPVLFAPGILLVQAAANDLPRGKRDSALSLLAEALTGYPRHGNLGLVVLCDDSEFAAANWSNFLWVTFTRTDPAADLAGVNEKIGNKHWACEPPLLMDARSKPHHAPVLTGDAAVEARIDALCVRGGPLFGIIA